MSQSSQNLSDPDDYILDLSSANRPAQTPQGASADEQSDNPRPFLSIHFKCCNVYNRIYKNATGDAYVGHCPRCARQIRAPIGPGGSSRRTFVAE